MIRRLAWAIATVALVGLGTVVVRANVGPGSAAKAPTGTVTGVVKTSDGKPVGGIRLDVTLLLHDPPSGTYTEPVVGSGTTDAKGRFGITLTVTAAVRAEADFNGQTVNLWLRGVGPHVAVMWGFPTPLEGTPPTLRPVDLGILRADSR